MATAGPIIITVNTGPLRDALEQLPTAPLTKKQAKQQRDAARRLWEPGTVNQQVTFKIGGRRF